jgi:hypothetical protein
MPIREEEGEILSELADKESTADDSAEAV